MQPAVLAQSTCVARKVRASGWPSPAGPRYEADVCVFVSRAWAGTTTRPARREEACETTPNPVQNVRAAKGVQH